MKTNTIKHIILSCLLGIIIGISFDRYIIENYEYSFLYPKKLNKATSILEEKYNYSFHDDPFE